MTKTPEILMKCCGRTRKPYSIKVFNKYVKIIFHCPICRNWVYLESRDTINKVLNIERPQQLPFKYNKRDDNNGQKRNKKTIK